MLHRLLLKCVNQVFKSSGSLWLVMDSLLLHKSLDRASDFIFISVLVRVVTDVVHDEVFCDAEVLIIVLQLCHMRDQVTGQLLDLLQVLTSEI